MPKLYFRFLYCSCLLLRFFVYLINDPTVKIEELHKKNSTYQLLGASLGTEDDAFDMVGQWTDMDII